MSFFAKPNPNLSRARTLSYPKFGLTNLKIGLAGPLILAGLCASGTAHANEVDWDPRFWVEAGIYLPDADTQIQLSRPDSDNGTVLSLEDDLGFKTGVESFDLTLGAKLDDDFFIEGSIFALDRSSTLTLSEAIEVEDVVYDVGARIDADFSSEIFRITLGYRIIANPKFDASVALGVHLTSFDFGIIGEASANGQTANGEQRGQDLLAPLPTLTGQIKYRPTPWLELRGRADYLDLTIDQYDGKLVNLEASATAAITRNIALGAAYRFTDYKVGIDADSYDGNIEYKFDGPRWFVRIII